MNEMQNVEEIKKNNDELLEIFREDLTSLRPKTINRHVMNVNLFINDFLANRHGVDIVEGCTYIDAFLGDFFIRKCMWSSPQTITSTATSIKKFYQLMVKKGVVSQDIYNEVVEEMKNRKEIWKSKCEYYNDPYTVFDYDEWLSLEDIE